MLIDRIYTPGLAQVAYLIADEDAGAAAVIDPRRDVDAYLGWADERDFQIVAILETHVHADFVSGSLELAAATGAPIFASRLGNQEFPHRPLDTGDEIVVGEVIVRALWTPGHTPEHLGYLAIDPATGEPAALFTGDTLFAGEVGRPDLLGEGKTQYLVEQLQQTLTERLASLDDAVIVYPGHTAGSACGRSIGDAPYTTMGAERRDNYAFGAKSKQAFGHLVLDDMPPPPTYYPVLKRLNAAGAPLLDTLPPGEPLDPDAVAARQAAGALVLDARSQDAFGAGHVPGAQYAGLGPNFTAWMGWRAPYDRDLILVLEDDEEYASARTDLRRIGLDRVAGYLAGGMAAWTASGHEIVTLAQETVNDLAERIAASPEPLVVLDVRRDDEWQAGHIAGAVHLFAGAIVQGAAPPNRSGPVHSCDLRHGVPIECGRQRAAGARLQAVAQCDRRHGRLVRSRVAGDEIMTSTARQCAGDVTNERDLLMLNPFSSLPNVPETDVTHTAQAREDGSAQIVDVREPEEWAEGHIPGAIHIPLGELAARTGELDSGQPAIVVCRSGRRSLYGAETLLQAGFGDAKSLAGGMVDWEAAGQPVER